MTEPKTRAQALVAAEAVRKTRGIAFARGVYVTERALCTLETRYRQLAEDLSKPKRKKKR